MSVFLLNEWKIKPPTENDRKSKQAWRFGKRRILEIAAEDLKERANMSSGKATDSNEVVLEVAEHDFRVAQSVWLCFFPAESSSPAK